MAVAFDAVGPSSAGTSNAGSSPLTWNHTCGAGATALYVGVAVCTTPGAQADNTITCTATYNGIAMTALSPGQSSNGTALTGNDGFVKVFRLASPPTGSAFQVSVTITPNTNNVSNEGGSISVTGSSTESALVQGFNAGTVTSGSVAIPSTTAGNLCLAFVGDGTGGEAWTSGTLRYLNDASSSGGAGATTAATLASPGGTATLSWTMTGDSYGVIGFEVQAGAAPSTYAPSPVQQVRRARRGVRTRRYPQQSTFPPLVPSSVTGPFTVTATQGGSTSAGMALTVRVVNGATGVGATAVNTSQTAGWGQAITPNASGSRVFGSFLGFQSGSGPPVFGPYDAGTTLVADGAGNTLEYIALRSSALTTAGQAVTLGCKSPSTNNISVALAEILGFPAEDASSPPLVAFSNTLAVTTAPFAPPTGAMLVALVEACGGAAATTMAITDTSGLGMTWTEQVKQNVSGDGYAGVWTAVVPAPAAGITRVNASSLTGSSTGANVTVTIPAGTGIRAGDLLVASTISNGTTPGTSAAVSDSVNGSWTRLLATQESNASSAWLVTFWLASPGAVADGSTITFATPLSATTCGIAVDIFRGCSGAIDQAVVGPTNSSPGTVVAAPALGANATAGALVLTFAGGAAATTLTQGTPFLAGSINTAQRCNGNAYVLSASGSSTYASTWTQGTSGSQGAQTVSFLAASGGGTVTGAASLSGTGTMTVAGTQQPTVALSGTGTMTQAETQQVTVALSGTGTITAGPPGVAVTGAASLSGTGTLSTAVTQQATVALSGTGALATAAVQAPAVALSGTGTMTNAEVQQPAVALSGTGTMTQAEVQRATVALSGTGTMTQAETQLATVALSGTGTMTQAEVQAPAVALSGSGTVTAGPPFVGVPGAASLSGSGTMTLTPAQQVTVSLTGSGTLSTAVITGPAVTLSGTGSMTNAEVQAPSVALSGTGTMTQAETQQATVALSGSGSLTTTVGGAVSGAASLSGTGTLSTAAIQQPSVALSGAGSLATQVTAQPGVSLSGSGVISVTPSWPAAASLSGTGSLSTAVSQGPGAALSGTGTMTTAWAAQPGVALSGSGTLSAVVRASPQVSLSGSGTLSTAVGGVQPATASLSGSGALTTAYLMGPAVAASGSGALSAGTQVLVPGAASLSGSGTLSAATGLFVAPAVALSGSGTLTTQLLGGTVTDTDSVRIEDSEFAVLSDPDATTGTDAGEFIRIRDTDSVKVTEAETSAWPHDSDSIRVTEDGGWSGPVADLTPETLHLTEGGERIRVSDTESAATADAHVVQVWTYQPPFRWTGSKFALHWGDRVAWEGPRLDRAAFELADRLAQASNVEFIHDSDQASIVDSERFGLLNVQLTVRPALEVTLTIDA